MFLGRGLGRGAGVHPVAAAFPRTGLWGDFRRAGADRGGADTGALSERLAWLERQYSLARVAVEWRLGFWRGATDAAALIAAGMTA
jgi:hypothetical protein